MAPYIPIRRLGIVAADCATDQAGCWAGEVAFTRSATGGIRIFNQGTDSGIFARNVADLGNCVAAFWNDLDSFQDDVTVMTMTEFGRTVHQNGTGGTDHGRASCNFILGSRVAGGKVYGDVKPLAVENLEDGRDLAVTTDFRSVFSAVADAHLEIANDKVLFPDWSGGEGGGDEGGNDEGVGAAGHGLG